MALNNPNPLVTRVVLDLDVKVTYSVKASADGREVTVVLALMSVMAVGLGALRPERSLIAGAILGYSIIVAHAVTEGMGWMRPSYLHSAVATGDWIAMAVLGLWIIALAWFGGWLRTRLELSHAA